MSDDRTVFQTPGTLSKRFLPLTKSDKVVASVLGFWVFVLFIQYRMLGLVSGIAVSVFLLWSQKWDKTYGIPLTKAYDFGTEHIWQDVFWENDDLLKKLGIYVKPAWWRRVLQAVFRRKHAYPIRVDWMNDPLLGEIGLQYNSDENTDTVAIKGDGASLSRDEPADQFSGLMRWADAIRRINAGVPVTVTVIARPRPPDARNFDMAIDNSHHPESVVPEVRLMEQETGYDAEQLYLMGKITKEQLRWDRLNRLAIAEPRQIYEEEARENDYVVTITVPRDTRASRATRRIKPKLLSDSEIRRLPIVRALKTALTALQSINVEGVEILDKAAMEEFCAEQRPNSTEWEGHETGLPSYHPKVGIYGDKEMTSVDGIHYVAYRVETMLEEQDPGAISRLFTHTSPQVILAAQGDTSKGTKEGSFLFLLESIIEALTENMRLGRSFERRRSGVGNTADQISQSGHILYMNLFVVLVVYGDLDDVVEQSDTLIREASGMDFGLDPAPGSSHQLRVMRAANIGSVRI